MSKKLFEYAVIIKETKDDEAGVIVDVTPLLAKDETEVRIVAAREIPEEYAEELGRVEILIRPFA